ncbi:GMP synthetase C-terminal dimerization domain-containing protein [Colletotrichum falcatum]|nr:GMP synthetase C-terminal dimerization domain-containing protein [Colletotrichum falcatum]
MASITEMEVETPHNNLDTILALNFGSQTSHLIPRRLRALKVYAEMLPCTTKLADLPFKPKGIVLSGGPHVDPAVFDLGVPILGICYGFAVVASTKNSEYAVIAHQTKPRTLPMPARSSGSFRALFTPMLSSRSRSRAPAQPSRPMTMSEAGIYDQMSQGYAMLAWIPTEPLVCRVTPECMAGYIVILRAVQTADSMSCEPFEFDFSLLKKMSTRIVNEVEGVSRVVYDITSKPPGTIELE